ncbi:MAG: hypothetical protein IPI73_25730, partial [Betaproteobacteria bacterium]|nr:hypothetical protein [Betaproteobacteria bacterium]
MYWTDIPGRALESSHSQSGLQGCARCRGSRQLALRQQAGRRVSLRSGFALFDFDRALAMLLSRPLDRATMRLQRRPLRSRRRFYVGAMCNRAAAPRAAAVPAGHGPDVGRTLTNQRHRFQRSWRSARTARPCIAPIPPATINACMRSTRRPATSAAAAGPSRPCR